MICWQNWTWFFGVLFIMWWEVFCDHMLNFFNSMFSYNNCSINNTTLEERGIIRSFNVFFKLDKFLWFFIELSKQIKSCYFCFSLVRIDSLYFIQVKINNLGELKKWGFIDRIFLNFISLVQFHCRINFLRFEFFLSFLKLC